jgi:hypothetical protein
MQTRFHREMQVACNAWTLGAQHEHIRKSERRRTHVKVNGALCIIKAWRGLLQANHERTAVDCYTSCY